MAQLPPKPPIWRRHSFRRAAIWTVGLLALAGTVLLWFRVLEPVVLADGSVNADTWVGLFSSVISAVLGGLAAVGVLLLTLRNEWRKQAREEHRQVVEHRLDLADELGDLVGTLNVRDVISASGKFGDSGSWAISGGSGGAEVLDASLRAARIVRKIDRTWADQHEGRHISIALFNGVAELRTTYESDLNQDDVIWLREHLLPGIESLTNAMAHRDTSLVSATAFQLQQLVDERRKRA